MSFKDENSPPKAAYKFFEWFCDSRYFEELQGDLEEHFHHNCESSGPRKASVIYWKGVLGMLRPSVISKVKINYPLNNVAMLGNYSIIAFRSIARNKLFSFVNITGLAISMAVGLLAIGFLNETYSYDRFHEKGDRIYRIITGLKEGNDPTARYASSSVILGSRLKEDFTGYEKIVAIHRNFSGEAKKGDNTISLKGLLADESFFDIFSFSLISGDPETALKEPLSLVLTQSSALKLFGHTDVVGETVEWDKGNTVTITGICQDPPRKSHMQFEAVGSFSTLELMNRNNQRFMTWQNMWNSHTYALLSPGTDKSQLQENLDQLANEENSKSGNHQAQLELQQLEDIFPGEKLYNEIGARMEVSTVNSILILSAIVLFSACFNYTNLSIARSLKRAKEVGVRKVIGAYRGQLLVQFVLEAVIIALLALIFAYVIFIFLRPQFLALNQNIERYLTMEMAFNTYLYFLFFAIGVGIVAGIIPALVLSKFRTIQALKGHSSLMKHGGLNARKILIVLQFTFSMAFAIMVTLTYKQYRYVLNFDLGFNTENVLNVNLQGNNPDLMINALSRQPNVLQASASNSVPSVGGLWRDRGIYAEGRDTTIIYNLHISEGYLDNLGHKLIAGSDFKGANLNKQGIINEHLQQRLGIKTAEEAIGQHIWIQGKKRIIVGVVADFHYGTLDNDIEPFMFLGNKSQFEIVNLKVASSDITKTLVQLEELWEEVDQVNPFRATFYDDRIERAYSDISSSLKTLGLLAIVAIVISTLGLLGMAVYTSEIRMKEMTIRKVLGAQTLQLIRLLSRNFLMMFLLSVTLAIPTTYYAFKSIIISDFVYTINIGIIEMSTGAIIVLAVAMFAIGSQLIRTAVSNPIKYLRNE